MARNGIQYEDVQRAIDTLLRRDEAPTVQKIRDILGTGSFTTISDHLREWRLRRERNRDVTPGDAPPEPLQEWMGRNIHHHGQCFSAAELVARATGQPLSHEPLVDYLKNKLLPLYGLAPEPV